MAVVSLRLLKGSWLVSTQSRVQAEAVSVDIVKAAERGRERVWQLAESLTREGSPWELEYFKAMLGTPETTLGLAEMLADGSLAEYSGELSAQAPDEFVSKRTVNQVMARRGRHVKGAALQAAWDRVRFFAAASLAVLMLVIYLARVRKSAGALPRDCRLLLAAHAEWATRTKHVLSQLGTTFTPDAILILGRPRVPLKEIARRWSRETGLALPPIVVPASPLAGLLSLPMILRLLGKGMVLCAQQPYLPPLREQAAIAFRVFLGAVMARWWTMGRSSSPTVIYGHTGTADTTMLENAQQAGGSETIHMVHGLATGPNLVGFSNTAVFRCGFDADQYARLRQYGQSVAPPMPMPAPRRGEAGLLLLTNLAHPMNPRFATHGIADELTILRDVAQAADSLGMDSLPRRWKPHPVIANLSAIQRRELLQKARDIGYQVVASKEPLEELASCSRWVLTTPSTVSMDLLTAGYLTIVLDWQNAGRHTAPMQFPTIVEDVNALKVIFRSLKGGRAYDETFTESWNRLRPAHCKPPKTLVP